MLSSTLKVTDITFDDVDGVDVAIDVDADVDVDLDVAAAHLSVVYYFSKQGNTVSKFGKRDVRRSNATAIERRRSAFISSNARLSRG